jgi:uncharacterized protein involved in response to NO
MTGPFGVLLLFFRLFLYTVSRIGTELFGRRIRQGTTRVCEVGLFIDVLGVQKPTPLAVERCIIDTYYRRHYEIGGKLMPIRPSHQRLKHSERANNTANVRSRDSGFALFALGFRPFFLVAGVLALALVAAWTGAYRGDYAFNTYFGTLGWHSHEMVFGYAVAVIAGFLLTAVRNWTGLETLQGGALAALILLWLAGRILPLFPDNVPSLVIALVDLTFLPVLAVSVAWPILRQKQYRQSIFIVVLAAMTLGNVLVHLQHLEVTRSTAVTGTMLALELIVLLIVVVGGRVIPFFTERAIADAKPRVWRPVERISIGSVIVLMLVQLLAPASTLAAIIAAIAVLSHAIRLYGWYTPAVWSRPLLWVLYLGYGWLIIGFALQAMAALGAVAPPLSIHAITVGAIGVLTLGMMARVALGHTGRPLVAPRPMTWAFVLINLAAMARVLFPILLPQMYGDLVVLSAALWLAAYLIFVVIYTPILMMPRVDRPG